MVKVLKCFPSITSVLFPAVVVQVLYAGAVTLGLRRSA